VGAAPSKMSGMKSALDTPLVERCTGSGPTLRHTSVHARACRWRGAWPFWIVRGYIRPPKPMLETARHKLTRFERIHCEIVKRSFDGPYDTALRWCQRTIGATWINFFTQNLRHVHGLHRLPDFDMAKSYLCVANHRSFFDLYVVTAFLVGRR